MSEVQERQNTVRFMLDALVVAVHEGGGRLELKKKSFEDLAGVDMVISENEDCYVVEFASKESTSVS